jgi:glutamate-ammonia-ligase adenylyltransferase
MNLYEVKEKLEGYLGEIGFADTGNAYYRVKELLDYAPDIPDIIGKALVSCGDSLNPDDCLFNLTNFVGRSISPYTVLKELVTDERYLNTAFTIFSASKYLSSILMVDPNLFYWLFESGTLYVPSVEEIRGEAFSLIDRFKTREFFLDALNHFKMKYLLLFAVRELIKLDDINRTTLYLSNLADIILETGYRINKRDYPDSEFAVLSLGKLGGREVNFSSDLDLIFVSDNKQDRRVINFARSVIDDLTFRSKNGYLFRIDMRLRPEGELSPLVTDFGYMRNYLETRARAWERQAYIRARLSAGDINIGNKALDVIGNFVYRETLTIYDIRSIIFIKNEMDGSVSGAPVANVKKGMGGIRDIEFIVQAFQLLFGKRIKELRSANIFFALDTLYYSEIISLDEVELLKEGYYFLRRLEHYLQLQENLQVFELPDDKGKLKILSNLMGYGDTDSFNDYYMDMRSRIRELFTEIFSRLFGEGEIAPVSEIVMNTGAEEKQSLEILSSYGFKEPKNILRFLQNIASISPRIKTSLALSLNFVLKECSVSLSPDETFFNLFSIMQSYGALSMFLRLIRYDNKFRDLLAGVISGSGILSSLVKDSPGIIDMFLDPEALDTDDDIGEYFGMVMDVFGGDFKKSLERLKDELFFKTSIREYGGAIDFFKAGMIYSDVIDFVIDKSASYIERPETSKYVIIAMGRLGCREMMYGSDADVVFLYDGDVSQIADYSSFFRDLIKFCSKSVELDARLRPNGKNSSLCMNLSGFREYLHDKAEFWEKVAYRKSRIISRYDTKSACKIEDTIRRFVLDGDNSQDRSEILNLREKIHSAYTVAGEFNIKKDAGGIMDMDFIVFEEIRKRKIEDFSYSTYVNLRNFGMDKLAEVYQFYRRMENALRITKENIGSGIKLDNSEFMQWFGMRLGFSNKSEFEAVLEKKRNYVKGFLET